MQTITWCPHCGRINEALQHVRFPHYRPIDGDLAICMSCGEWGIFTEAAQKIRTPTAAEMRGILSDPQCRQQMAAWTSARRVAAHTLH